ncbi:MAG: DUF4834 family protein [Flavicella sp.]
MEEAGIIGFMRTLIIMLLVLYGLRFLSRTLFPWLLKNAVKKAQERAQQQFQNSHSNYEKSGKVGETTIDKKPQKKSQSSSNNVGDYVDFEEID